MKVSGLSNRLIGWMGIATLLSLTALVPQAAGQAGMGARALGMAHATSALPTDAWAVFHNASVLANTRGGIGFSSTRYFGLRELEDHAFTLTTRIATNRKAAGLHADPDLRADGIPAYLGAGFGVHTYGFELYRLTRFRAGLAAGLGRVRAGMVAEFRQRYIRDHARDRSVHLDAGISGAPHPDVTLGIRIQNLLPGLFLGEQTGAAAPAVLLAAGVGWHPSPALMLTAELAKEGYHTLTLRTAVETKPAGLLWLRGGLITEPFIWSMGVGLPAGRLQLHMAVQHHEFLGLSPGLECVWVF